jgi:hypothetical protein
MQVYMSVFNKQLVNIAYETQTSPVQRSWPFCAEEMSISDRFELPKPLYIKHTKPFMHEYCIRSIVHMHGVPKTIEITYC